MMQASETLYQGDDLEALADLANYNQWIVESFQPYLKGDAVELGCGIGTISRLIEPYVDSLDAVEPSANLVVHLRDRLVRPTTSVCEEDLQTYLARAAPASRDTVIMVNVLEHIEDDAYALKACHRILRPGSHLLIYVPAMQHLFSAMDLQLGHFRRYQAMSLSKIVSDAGFTIVETRYQDQLGYFAWWLLHRRMGKIRFSRRMAVFYDRYCVPITRTWESLATPTFGKNLLLIARR